jgi:polysaccharide export outer membrane protein
MFMDFAKKLLFVITVVGLVFPLSGCLTYKQIVNFQDGDDLKTGRVDSIANSVLIRLQPDDVVQITIGSYDEESANKFNILDFRSQVQMARVGGGGATIAEPIGYRVDSEGYIDMPVLGRVNVMGLSIEQLRDSIHNLVDATGYLKDVNVHVRFVSFRITILGEVNAPGVYTITNTKITILEALGMARDVSVFSNRDNILVIREENGVRTYGRLDLKTKDIFESPYYYLKTNDIIYVEPHKSRILGTPDPVTRYVGTIIAVATLITLMIALFR